MLRIQLNEMSVRSLTVNALLKNIISFFKANPKPYFIKILFLTLSKNPKLYLLIT